ncbi:MAG TPA: hypothetical protein DCQ06_08100 [Myxococcales bacterium]|nr:hypothetical protein [Myxococcales bacterium]
MLASGPCSGLIDWPFSAIWAFGALQSAQGSTRSSPTSSATDGASTGPKATSAGQSSHLSLSTKTSILACKGQHGAELIDTSIDSINKALHLRGHTHSERQRCEMCPG